MVDLRGFRSWWTAAFIVGELVGFIPPAIVGAWLGSVGAVDVVLVLGLTVAGALEGASIGAAQAWVLRRYRSPIPFGSWVLATAGGASAAWCAGMAGGAVMGSVDSAWPLAVFVPLWIVGLMAMGFLQWLVMRGRLLRTTSWLLISPAAWLIGVLIPVVAITATPDQWSVAAHVVPAVLAAVLMGAVVGLLTATAMRRYLRRPAP